MAYAITQTCCTDASCVAVCPVNCIHPTPDEPDFGSTDMLYIDPETCIDCGACADACPVEAIFPIDKLTGSLRDYADINAAHYANQEQPQAQHEPQNHETQDHGPQDLEPVDTDPTPNFHQWGPPGFDRTVPSDFPKLDVAVVGTGPAGMYAVEDLLLRTNARVTLIDRLTTTGGLVRYGVAPDHPSTKKIQETFDRFHHHARLRLRLGVRVGTDITAAELAAEHDAVIYAVGASTGRELDLPGAHLPGNTTATKLVSWYNGHPDTPADAIDLATERALVVGNGNVALDAARILTTEPDELASTSISRAALDVLRTSSLREVVLLGRRGPEDAAYTVPELRALVQRYDVDVVVDAHDPRSGSTIDSAAEGSKAGLLKHCTRETVDWSAPPPPGRRIVLRFHSSPQEFLGEDAVRGLRVTGRNGDVDVAGGRVFTAVGHRGEPFPGLPFDERTATVPHDGGRVVQRSGTYVVGWIKRGPSGGIGSNRACARETVNTMLDDVMSGRLSRTRRGAIANLTTAVARRFGKRAIAGTARSG